MDALNSIQNIFNYLQHSSDIKTNASVISGMKDLQCQIQRKQIASLKQPTIETFYKKLNYLLYLHFKTVCISS